nr:hypothetical protein [Tanacetum cinerariifolium]
LYVCVEYESGVLGSERGRSDQDGLDYVMKDAPSSYANKLSRMSLNMANPRKLDTNVPNGADIWLLLASANEVNDRTENYIYGYFIVLRDGPWMIHGFPIFLNKWSPFMSLLKEELSRVRVWVKFHDVIGNLVTSIPNIEEPRYLEGTIRVDYEWELPCYSMCLIFSHSVVDFPKAPKREVNRLDKRKGGSSEADDEGFVEVKREEIGWESMTNASTLHNCTFSLGNSFEGTCVLVDYDGKPMKMVDYLDDHDNEDKVEPIDNKMAYFMASKLSGLDMVLRVCWNNIWKHMGMLNTTDDLYERQEIPDHIQSICDNFDIKVRSRKKK